MSKEQNQGKKQKTEEPKKYQKPTLIKYPALKQVVGVSTLEGAAAAEME